MADQLQFEVETIQVTKQVEVAPVTLTGEQVAQAICTFVCALYSVTDSVTIRLPDYLAEQGLSLGVVREIS
jgi:hypothetical protein